MTDSIRGQDSGSGNTDSELGVSGEGENGHQVHWAVKSKGCSTKW